MKHHEYWDASLDEVSEQEYIHPSELEDVECAKDFISQAVQGLYGNGSLEQIERSLEEACAYLKIPFPNKELTITKKNPYFEFGVSLSKGQARVLSRNTVEGE